jgi:hypothetical protein
VLQHAIGANSVHRRVRQADGMHVGDVHPGIRQLGDDRPIFSRASLIR